MMSTKNFGRYETEVEEMIEGREILPVFNSSEKQGDIGETHT